MEKKDHEERPIECNLCSKSLKYKYTEVQETITTHYFMCRDCPFLKQYFLKPEPFQQDQKQSHLTCGHCKTPWIEIQRGELIGCPDCYDLFEASIVNELKKSHLIPSQCDTNHPLHLGHKQGEAQKMSPSLQIFALNEVLTERLAQEDYEQAALIRDQIKALKKGRKNIDS